MKDLVIDRYRNEMPRQAWHDEDAATRRRRRDSDYHSRVILGLLIFGVLSNGLNQLPNIPITFKQALQGIVLPAALLLNVFALRLERVRTRGD